MDKTEIDYTEFLSEGEKLSDKRLTDKGNKQVEERLNDSGLALHNSTTRCFDIIHEKPEHRALIYMKAQGLSTREIYQKLGGKWICGIGGTPGKPGKGGQYSYVYLTQIFKQPWFMERLVTMMDELGRDVVQNHLEEHCIDNLEIVQQLASSATSESVRLNAANSMLDRYLGKPMQHIKTEKVKGIHEMEAEAEDLDNELASINEQLNSLIPTPVR